MLTSLVLTGLYSCHNENRRTITEATPQDTGIYNPKWTYKTSDGYTIIDSLGFGPQNRRILYYDKKKRFIGMAGMASEVVDFNFVRVLYDESDNVETYLWANSLSYLLDSNDDGYDEEKLRDAILDPDEKNKGIVRFKLKKDADGNIVEVTDSRGNNRIKASDENVIRVEIAENFCFWGDDVRGGYVLLNFYIEPTNKNVKQYTIKKYCFYDLQMEYTFTNGEKTKVVIYSPKTHKSVVTMERKIDQTNGITLYDKTYSDDKNIYRSKWKDGVLQAKEKISPYGTTLRQILYVVSQDGKAVISYYKEFDYKMKKLVRRSEERQDISEFIRLNKEEDVMVMYDEMYEYWNSIYSVDR